MSLIEKLTEFEVEKQRYRERDVLDVIDLTTTDLVATGIVGRALGVGARVPDFPCSDRQGNTVQLSDVITNRPRIVVVYRGIRCPYFNLELRTYQNALPRLREFKPCTRNDLVTTYRNPSVMKA